MHNIFCHPKFLTTYKKELIMQCKILAFSTEDCPACDIAKPIFKKIANKVGIQVKNLDPTNEIELAQTFNVNVMPTFVLVDSDGEFIESLEGFVDEKIIEQFLNLIPA
jgi:thiol-disulfide isomerase/thioredoxin